MAKTKAKSLTVEVRVVEMLTQTQRVVDEATQRYRQGDGEEVGNNLEEDSSDPKMNSRASPRPPPRGRYLGG